MYTNVKSLCGTPEANWTFYINYTSITKKFCQVFWKSQHSDDLYWASCQVFQYLSVFLVEILVNLILGSSVSHNWFLKKFTSILIIFVKRKVREFSLIWIFYWAKKFANREASNRNWYEVQKHNVTGWIKKWKRSCLIFTKIGYYKTGYKEGRGLLKRDYLVSF